MNSLVIFAPNWLGDLIMALPAITSLRLRYPDAHLTVAARGSVAPLLPMVDGVNAVLPLDPRRGWRAVMELAADAERVAEGRFDAAVLLPNSFHSAMLVKRAGVPERWGYRADWRGALLTRAIPKPRGMLHQAEYYLALATALGGPPVPLTASIRVPDAALRAATTRMRDAGWSGGPIAVFAPGAAFGPAKRWPPDRVGALAATLARGRGLTPVVVGAMADSETAAEVRTAYEQQPSDTSLPGLVNLTGRTDLAELAGVLAQAAVVVSNDSGAMHLAAAVGAPVVAVFGPTDHHRTAPLLASSASQRAIVVGEAWCRPCQLRRCPIDHRCMTSVGVERVDEEVRRLLSVPRARAGGRG